MLAHKERVCIKSLLCLSVDSEARVHLDLSPQALPAPPQPKLFLQMEGCGWVGCGVHQAELLQPPLEDTAGGRAGTGWQRQSLSLCPSPKRWGWNRTMKTQGHPVLNKGPAQRPEIKVSTSVPWASPSIREQRPVGSTRNHSTRLEIRGQRPGQHVPFPPRLSKATQTLVPQQEKPMFFPHRGEVVPPVSKLLGHGAWPGSQ